MIADINIIEKSFGSKQLYSGLKMSLQASEKVGLIGRNGIGKSTLFGVMAGTDTDFQGNVTYQRGVSVASTRQEHHGFENKQVMQYILEDLPEYLSLKTIIDTYPDKMGDDMNLMQEFTDALERFGTLGFYTIENEVLASLAGMQIPGDIATRPLGSLSGGQKRLVEVVKIMHSNADLALVDEPTNHMDYVSKSLFVDWFKDVQESVLVITHDRDVLQHVDRIIEIKDGQAFSHRGNYDQYLKSNAHATANRAHDYEVVQRQIENLKDKVIQFRRMKERARDPDTIKQFKRRENQAAAELAELEKIEKPSFWIDRESAATLGFKAAENYQKYKAKNIRIGIKNDDSKSKRQLVHAVDLSLGYDGNPLFTGLNMELRENERLELRGRNGAGKTTLIKAILYAKAGKVPNTLISGDLKAEPTISVGVYEQEVASQYFELRLSDAIERMYLDNNLSITTQKVMQLMSDYLFDPTLDAGILVKNLSGGQKARLQMIAMLMSNPQLLILDEPTNHLDLPSIEELESALARYTGAVLFVSHDNYFREKMAAEVLLVGMA